MKMTKDDAAEYIRQELTNYIKKRNGVLFLVGHNTKEGEFAGKNTNMQMVDAHMVLEFDKKNNTRKIYWGQKNRKGPMTSMFYEIHDGTIRYFNNDEYKTSAVEDSVLKVKEKKSFTLYSYFPLLPYLYLKMIRDVQLRLLKISEIVPHNFLQITILVRAD